MQKYLLMIASLCLIVSYQNCQQATRFSGPVELSAKATEILTPVESQDDEDLEDTEGEITSPGMVEGEDPEVAMGDEGSGEDDDSKKNEDKKNDDKKDDDGEETAGAPPEGAPPLPNPPVSDTSEDADAPLYVCVLKGPGKSIKLGMLDAALSGQHQIPNVLCMTKEACLEIAGTKFKVVGAFKRGYCKSPHGNPHVKHISNTDMKKRCGMP